MFDPILGLGDTTFDKMAQLLIQVAQLLTQRHTKCNINLTNLSRFITIWENFSLTTKKMAQLSQKMAQLSTKLAQVPTKVAQIWKKVVTLKWLSVLLLANGGFLAIFDIFLSEDTKTPTLPKEQGEAFFLISPLRYWGK